MISFNHIYKEYVTKEKVNRVYNDFSEQIDDGEFVVLTGESGSGKTTLIKMLLKEVEPTSGSVIVDGKDITKMKRSEIPYYRRSLGVLFQDFRLVQNLSVYDNLFTSILATGGSSKEAESKIINVLTMLEIDHLHKRYPKELSGGEQQKVCLARAIINNPGILLVDEPTGNLDPDASREINRLLDIVNGQGVTVVMATHDLEAAGAAGRRRIDLDQINQQTGGIQ